LGDSICALTQTDSGVDVTFDHQRPQSFDVVIGADGIHSNVRALAFGDENQFVRHLDPYATVISRTRGQLLRRNLRLLSVPWLQRVGLGALLRPKLKEAATDLQLVGHDLRSAVRN
jgi:2-polyprenyl-6-methoxyphenol hydroxylase-like FAD-dependent oxidoreductase